MDDYKPQRHSYEASLILRRSEAVINRLSEETAKKKQLIKNKLNHVLKYKL